MEEGMPESGSLRGLRDEERELIQFLAAGLLPTEKIDRYLVAARVADMGNGGMGSIRFSGPSGRKLGKVLVEALYHDLDGVLVSISLNLDTRGEIFELDFWKVDFSSLKRYPNYSDLDRKRKV